MTPPKLQFSLRSHGASITTILPLPQSQQLITADTTGLLILRNLITRRPIRRWQGHESDVITLIQLDSSHVLSHSRDSEIKIWNLDKIEKDRDGLEYCMPVNAVNFSNIIWIPESSNGENGYLMTPASVDSNGFDVYKLSKSDGIWKMTTRVITNYSGYNLVHKQPQVDGEIGSRGDFGIIMKMTHDISNNDVIYLGYESGDIVGISITFNPQPTSASTLTSSSSKPPNGTTGGGLSKMFKETNRTIINHDPQIKLMYHNSTHSPNPIISLTYDSKMGLISGSTGKKIIIHSTEETIKLNQSGIQSIQTHDTSNMIVVGYWNGMIEGYDSQTKACEWDLKRSLPRIKTVMTNQGGVDESEENVKGEMKLSYMVISSMKGDDEENGERGKKKSYKELIRRKKNQNLDSNLLFTGYEDGTINVFKI
ncbi:asa1 [[Candida] subhashii]|uniref:Asa1 n=1 Tax=[Candida] subhashii TaxID=561895 RepID=A0A8J5QJC0_9ASCO|nr:asa1 [[Candida] subhashii]KAG7662141.1 asa1 [[Candida] subhashii]